MTYIMLPPSETPLAITDIKLIVNSALLGHDVRRLRLKRFADLGLNI